MAKQKQTKPRTSKGVERKKKELAKLVKLIDESNTIMITYTTSIPSSQLQQIRKQLKGSQIKIIKKNLLMRAFESSKKEKIKEMKDYLKESSAIIFSNTDAFDLASMLAEHRYSVKAKTGQTAEDDIKIEEGPTELMPGPVISEFGAMGIKTGIVGGKVAIKQAKTLVKKGEKITKKIANILSKLDITPFKIGLDPIAVFDSKENKVYKNIIINKEATLENMKEGKTNVLKLAYSIIYPIKEIIGLLLSKASSHANALNSKVQTKEPKVKAEEKPAEQKPAEETKQEQK